MSYADATRSGSNGQGRYINKNMLVCQTERCTYEEIAEALYEFGYWKAVTGFQRLDFHHLYGVVFSNPDLREKLFDCGLNVNGINLDFVYHGTKQIKVSMSHLPLGVDWHEIRDELRYYGCIGSYRRVTRVIRGRQIDTGERIIFYTTLFRDIPSYVFLKGWQVAFKYAGQPKTCRFCQGEGHFARDCPVRRKKDEDSSSEEDETEKMDDTVDPKDSDSGDVVKEFLETLAKSGTSQNAGKSEVQDIPDPPGEDKDDKQIDIPQQPKDSSPVEGDQSAHVEQTVEKTSVVEEKMED